MKINDLFGDHIFNNTDTFFKILSNAEDYPDVVPFISDDNALQLCTEYFGGHSGDKFISPMLHKIHDHYADSFLNMNVAIANILYDRFSTKWKKIYDALMTEYNPLDNYAMEEVKTPELTITEKTNEKSKIKTERSTSATNAYKGFNASEPVLVNKTDGSDDVTTSGASADNEESKTIDHTGTETLVRSGNIGITTSQQMLESEIKIRQYDFYKQIFNDIDSVLCLSIY